MHKVEFGTQSMQEPKKEINRRLAFILLKLKKSSFSFKSKSNEVIVPAVQTFNITCCH